MGARQLRIGIIQFESVLGDVKGNTRKAGAMIADAAARGAQMVVFPEMFATGYNLDLIGEQLCDLALTGESPEVEYLKASAKSSGIWLVAPVAERRSDGKIYNSALIINPSGVLEGSYAKTHLWAAEKRYFAPGSGFLTFDTPFGRAGVMICYDAGFPEVARCLMVAGSELIVMPSAWRIQDKDIWDLNIPQRALENAVFVVAVNRVGHEGSLHLFGNSKVADPRGRMIAELPMDEEVVEVVALDLDLVQAWRKEIPYLGDRRPSLYSPLVRM